MKKGFTMIELIFVIVILGILAAVAIPKLSATRDDAQVTKIGSNLATAVADAGARWTANGSWPTNWSDLTNVRLNTTAGGTIQAGAVTSNAFLNTGTGATNGCYRLSTTTDGNLTVTALSAGSSVACVGAKTMTKANNLSGADDANLTHSFGGTGVTF